MISDSCDFNEFVLETKGRNYEEMIYLADREATEAERRFYHAKKPGQGNLLCGKAYAKCLKGVIMFIRYGIKPADIDEADLLLFENFKDKAMRSSHRTHVRH